ncbi:hypothetical protein VP01_10229g1, partial [Puccinia sorghi]
EEQIINVEYFTFEWILLKKNMTPNSFKTFFVFPTLPPKREWANTIKHTQDLWKISEEKTHDDYTSHQTEKGINDTTITNEIIELKLKSEPERLRIKEISKNPSSRLFNPFLKLNSFDGCQDTPVEFLHVFLLGILVEVEGRWSTFNTDTLNIPPVQPKFMINHCKSFHWERFLNCCSSGTFHFLPNNNTITEGYVDLIMSIR